MSWLAEIRHEIHTVIQRVGERPLAELGSTLSNAREGNEAARQTLAASPLLRESSEGDIVSLLAVAIGADAAHVASESGALGDALLEGAQREDLASMAADSLGLDAFLQARLDAARVVLRASTLPRAAAGTEEGLRVLYLFRESYEHFVADAVEAEVAEYAS